MEAAVLVFAGVLLGGAWSAPTPEVAPPELVLQPPLQVPVPVTYVSRHHAQDELGQVNYGFSHPGQAKNEVRDASGNVAGAFTYIDDENKVIRVEYTAGKDGFRVKSNNLPEGVKDTSDVLAAKLQFVEAYNAAALAAANAPDDSVDEAGKPEGEEAVNVAFPVHVVYSPVRDTPEVIAAKLQFVETYNAAALAAANAPDDPVEASADVESKTASVYNYIPVKDTPEVVAAKLQFVEAYNAAALAAAAAHDDPESEDPSKAVIVYANHAVKDTPEVVAAKLRFAEAYNAAAIAAALAPDDNVFSSASQDESAIAEVSEVTENPFVSDEPVTDLRGVDAQVVDATTSPNEDEAYGKITIVFPGRRQDNSQEQSQIRKIHMLKPVKVTEASATESEAPISFVQVPQVHSNSVVPPEQVSYAESPVILTPTVHLTAPQLNDPVIGAPVTYASRHHVQDELGQFSYGFYHPGQAKNELRDASGNVAGVYTYTDDEDKVIRVEYTAGEGGYQIRSNNLPVAATDTPEVLAAKLQFMEAYNAAALAAAAAPDYDVGTTYGSADDVVSKSSTFAIPNLVKDTPEVTAAKLQFVEEYNAAALAAAAAPDDPVDSKTNAEQKPAILVNPNPVQDTPEVLAAKLQFVEAYNAASLAAARAADNTESDSDSNVAVVYATPVVQDTPEVLAAKLKFVEEYNAAAIASALAPDDDIQQDILTEDPISELASENTHDLLPTLLSESLDVPNVDNDISVPVSVGSQSNSVVLQTNIPSIQAPAVPLTVPLVEVPIQSPVVAVPVTHISRHHAQDELGQVNYGFSHPGQAKNEIRDSSGNVAGVYTYVDSDDKVIRVEYTAGEGGFQVKSNNLPVGIPDTPEVLAAKLQFVETYNAAALAAAAAPDGDDRLPLENIESIAPKTTPILAPSSVRDTPEVLAAKLQFADAYNAAALAAAIAPDDPVVSSSKAAESLSSPNHIQDTPEVIADKLQFVEAYNSAALAAAKTDDDSRVDDTSKVSIVYATPAVQDTPEVIAAKLQFVEAYNAAAIAAALAPDDVAQEEITQKSEDDSSLTSFSGANEDESFTKVPQLQEDIEIVSFDSEDNQEKSEESQSPDAASTDTDLVEQYTIVYQGAPALTASDLSPYPGFKHYSTYPAGDGETSSVVHTNQIPFGVYAVHMPLVSTHGFLPQTYMKKIPLNSPVPQQNYGSSKQIVMYAPSHIYG